ncbi:YdcF family protein [Aerosakkonema funiforme]|uniref:YdcF family protein n=2 Tax=Oscillatoriophycideae TaxID=1301283 RepID=A0A926VEB5_9CYAN|nr:YdcF family protein [Aerosakkonema funiforme]MBD2182320.1 YdcF family protein [Aerosakkonema funiforme FACHB-1375]
MFSTLTQIMLVVLIGTITWQALVKGTGKDAKPRDYLAWVGLVLMLFFLILSFITPNDPAVTTFGSILTFPLKPLGLSILLLFLALTGEIKKKEKTITPKGMNQIWIAFLILTIFSLPLMANLLANRVQNDAIIGFQAALRRPQKVGAIVLLGHSATQLSLLAPNQIQLNDQSDRILQTVQEYQRQLDLNNFAKIIVSAGPRSGFDNAPNQSNRPEADKIAVTLESLGIPPQDIWRERTGLDVRSSAEAVKTQFVDRGKISKRVILVTSALNMQRARQTFAQLGISTIPSPAGFYSLQPDSTPRLRVSSTQKGSCDTLSITISNARKVRISDFVPSAEGLLISTRVINEFWTSVYYFLRGWLAPTLDAIPQLKDFGC